MITTDSFNPWGIEYEIPPLRAIYWAFADSTYTEEEARARFKDKIPSGRIRSIKRVTAWTDELKRDLTLD